MNIKPIENKADYYSVLREVESLMHATSGSPDGEKLDKLVTLIEAYENKHSALENADPAIEK